MSNLFPPDVVDLCADSPISKGHDNAAFAAAAAASATAPPGVAFAAATALAIDLCESADEGDNNWRGRRKRRRALRGYTGWNGNVINLYKSDPNEVFNGLNEPSVEVEVVGSTAPSREFEVLQIFPDADCQHIISLLQKYNADISQVVADLSERTYPKAQKSAEISVPLGSTLLRMDTKPKWSYDYSSSEAFTPSALYIREAAEQLMHDFLFLSKIGPRRILAKCKYRYAASHAKVVDVIKGSSHRSDEKLDDAQYRRILFAFAGNPLDEKQLQGMSQLALNAVLKRPRFVSRAPLITDSILKEEIAYVKEKLDDWLQTVRSKTDRKMNTEAAVREHNAVDCSCCFDEVAIQDMIACRDEGHLFCVDCFKSYAEHQVFGSGNLGIDKETKQPAMDLKCFHFDGCSSVFSRHALSKALPNKTLEKYDEIQMQTSLEAAGITDLCSCPKCGFQAALATMQKVFQCPVVDCRYESCRDCGEATHIPLRCEEVEKQVATQGRLTVEEAISDAKIRKCPRCSKGFIKSDGCNKIRCGCGVFVCYICREAITSYAHFCQAPHCNHASCNKCPLWTKAEEDDARIMREAGLAAAAKAEAKLLECASSSKFPIGDFRIDVESILKVPK